MKDTEKKIRRQDSRQPEGSPSAGATQPAGKKSEPKEGLGFHSGRETPKPEAVRPVEPDEGAHERCVNQQTGSGDSNPKKRTDNSFGIRTKDSKE